MTELAQLQADRTAAEHATAQGLAAWKKSRRSAWSRTDTARWLNDRSPAVVAWLRRRTSTAPERSKQVGYWLKEFSPRTFDRAHTVLTAAPNATTRDRLLPHEVIK